MRSEQVMHKTLSGFVFSLTLLSTHLQARTVRLPCVPPTCANLKRNARIRKMKPTVSAPMEALAVCLLKTTAPATTGIARGNRFRP
jgi:hypothetical protein